MKRLMWMPLALSLLSCGGYRPPTLGACGEGVSLDEEDCGIGNTVAADRCFPNEQAACDCLACPKGHCVIDDSDPGEATCVTEKPEEEKGTSQDGAEDEATP